MMEEKFEKQKSEYKYPNDWTEKEISEYEEAKRVWEEEAESGRFEQTHPWLCDPVLVE